MGWIHPIDTPPYCDLCLLSGGTVVDVARRSTPARTGRRIRAALLIGLLAVAVLVLANASVRAARRPMSPTSR